MVKRKKEDKLSLTDKFLMKTGYVLLFIPFIIAEAFSFLQYPIQKIQSFLLPAADRKEPVRVHRAPVEHQRDISHECRQDQQQLPYLQQKSMEGQQQLREQKKRQADKL